MEFQLRIKNQDLYTPLYKMRGITLSFYKALDQPHKSYRSGVEELLYEYCSSFYRNFEIDELLGNQRSKSSVNILRIISKKIPAWTLERLIHALYALENYRPLTYLVESVPVNIKCSSSSDITAQLNRPLELEVIADGFPPPEFIWYFNSSNGQCLPKVSTFSRKEFSYKSCLLIDNFQLCDQGIYTCCVQNYGGISCIEINVRASDSTSIPGQLCTPISNREDAGIVKEKLALLIGQMQYTSIHELYTPRNDVRNLARELEKLDYRVISLCDLEEDCLTKVIEKYSTYLQEEVYSFFYFAGHGYYFDGQNYCLATDCDLRKQKGDICAEKIIQLFQERKPGSNLFIFDMCREIDSQLSANKQKYVLCDCENLSYLFTTAINKKSFEYPTEGGTMTSPVLKPFLSDLSPVQFSKNPPFTKLLTEAAPIICEESKRLLEEYRSKHFEIEDDENDTKMKPSVHSCIYKGNIGDAVDPGHERLNVPMIHVEGQSRLTVRRCDTYQHIEVKCCYNGVLNSIRLTAMSREKHIKPVFDHQEINRAFQHCNCIPDRFYNGSNSDNVPRSIKDQYCNTFIINNLEKLRINSESQYIKLHVNSIESNTTISQIFPIKIDLPFIYNFLKDH